MPEEYPTTEIVAAGSDSGINTLPSEILSHIFTLGSEEYLADLFEPGSSSDEDTFFVGFTTLCSHICRYWRNVALETPQLWAYVDFKEDHPFERSQEWISRSKAVPLVLKIHHHNYVSEDSSEGSDTAEGSELTFGPCLDQQIFDFQVISTMIMPHAYRWYSLDIEADPFEILWLWGRELEKCPATPKLEHLRLSSRHRSRNQEASYPEVVFPRSILPLSAPKLIHVEFSSMNIDWEAATILRGLKTLQLAFHHIDIRPSVEQFVRMLEQSPEMEVLSLRSSAPCLGYWPHGRISLNSLRGLIIMGVDVATTIAIVEHVEFPALRELALSRFNNDSAEPFITAVCHRKRPRFRNVETLRLSGFPCQQQAAVQFLQSMPKITTLQLDFTHLPRCFYDALVQDPVSSPIVCRRLNILLLNGLNDQELCHLVVTRGLSRDVASIRELYYEAEDSTEYEEWLEKNMGRFEFFEPSDNDEEDDKDSEGEDEGED